MLFLLNLNGGQKWPNSNHFRLFCSKGGNYSFVYFKMQSLSKESLFGFNLDVSGL